MGREEDGLFYPSAAAIAAMLLGIVLIPLRDFTSASNLTFPFMALTIASAELGGPRAALAAALTSALSLDFFLTKPYQKLTIEGKHDIIAFFGLAACGLVAAAFSSRRSRRIAARRSDRGQLELIHAAVCRMEDGGPLEFVLAQVLDAARAVLPVSGLVARDEQGRIVAASGGGLQQSVPTQLLRLDTLLPTDSSARVLPRSGLPLPAGGGRIPLVVRNRRIGWLDVWGNGVPADAEARRTLSDVGRLASVWITWGPRATAMPEL